MPKQKDLKKLTRTRMRKTGESYTTARMQLIKKKTRSEDDGQYAEIAGMSDDAVRAKTGRTWKQWVRTLDAVDAVDMPHRDIARHLHDDHGVPQWWAQMVTVGYERIRGLREKGQRRGGAYEISKSKTLAVPVAKLYRAFRMERTRQRWLPGVDLTVRTATPAKSMRITWPGGTSIHVYFVSKGTGKSQVTVQHVNLPRKSDMTKMKTFWSERLDALADMLSTKR